MGQDLVGGLGPGEWVASVVVVPTPDYVRPTWGITSITDVNVTVGKCADKAYANCIKLKDFTAYTRPTSVAGYMSPVSLNSGNRMAYPRHLGE